MCKSKCKLKTYKWNRDVTVRSWIFPTQWSVFHSLSNYQFGELSAPPPRPTFRTKKRHKRERNSKHQRIGWWSWRSERQELEELRKLCLQTFFFFCPPKTPWYSWGAPLFVLHDSPVSSSLSIPAGTWCHFLGFTSDDETLPPRAGNRHAPSPSADCQTCFYQHLADKTLKLRLREC